MIEKIIIAGAGGQGIMLLGKVLAEAAMQEGKFVTWLPAYGAEVRGGTAHCMVIISDRRIGSPRINQPDSLIIMNNPSLKKFKERVKNKTLLIINSSLVDKLPPKNTETLSHPFTDLAIKLGNIKVANMLALGCYFARKNIVEEKTVLKVIFEMAPADKKGLVEINQKALKEGLRLR
ncbi:MAG: 2-oxoacid:ferredoxin oxidoreductase subunit gamma [Candidatus Omnitrophica bacterium]|nr:2-oxoacid:ferredoxin oxidoreductase subunit gamma [Candidatus Omnitrophota bacterium]